MKIKLFLLPLIIFLAKASYSQLSLPKVGTNSNKALTDLIKGVTNEQWFLSKDPEGCIVYNKYFKSTPVGIKHALKEYETLKETYSESDCIDESIYSKLAYDSEGLIDYEMLSLTIKSEASEVNKLCTLSDKVIRWFSLRSNKVGEMNYLYILIRTTKK